MKLRNIWFATTMFVLSGVLLFMLFLFAYTDISTQRPHFDMSIFFFIGALLIASTSLGLTSLLKVHQEEAFSEKMKSYRHLWRLGGVLVVVLVVAAVLKSLLVPDSYGQYGNYRGDALAEQMNIYAPTYQGKETCADCHDEIAEVHQKDVHTSVQCETCHGPGAEHVAVRTKDSDSKSSSLAIAEADRQELCMSCHQRMAARPRSFPQIDRDRHFEMLEVDKKDTMCSSCHSPHEPLFLDTPLADARQHPMVERCESCHSKEVDPKAELSAKHPNLFTCDYCHSALAKDYAERSHGQFDCRTCHQFYVDNERGGRVVKHRDPRFCLLCHETRDIVACDEKPCIQWPGHRDEVSEGDNDKEKVCVDCHRDAFHHAFSASDRANTKDTQP